MAKVYGSQSKYLLDRKKSHSRLSRVAFYIVFLISGFGVAYTLNLLKQETVSPNVKIISFIIPASIFLYVCYKLLYSYSRNEVFSKFYNQGSAGEDVVFATLEKLPDQFVIFRDVVFKKGNIDFVAVNGNTIFSIEVKSHKGRINFNGNNLLRNGYALPGRDFIQQAWLEGKSLKEFLQYKLGQDVQVVSLLVFSDPQAWVEIDPYKPVKFGVHVLHSRMLDKFLLGFHGHFAALNVPAIIEFLRPYVKGA